MLIILGGLPGTGKTTIGREVARRRRCVYIRVDDIEHALSHQLGAGIGPAGYVVAYAVATANLRLGLSVVADSVNAVAASREGWRRAAAMAGSRYLEVEVVCSDAPEHRRRVETRIADDAKQVQPTWASVQTRAFQPWPSADLTVDTALLSVEAAVERIEALLARLSA